MHLRMSSAKDMKKEEMEHLLHEEILRQPRLSNLEKAQGRSYQILIPDIGNTDICYSGGQGGTESMSTLWNPGKKIFLFPVSVVQPVEQVAQSRCIVSILRDSKPMQEQIEQTAVVELFWAGVGLGALQRCQPALVLLQFCSLVLSHSAKFPLINLFEDTTEVILPLQAKDSSLKR